jgi:6-pyruvoyl-tetrahydropterin synthase
MYQVGIRDRFRAVHFLRGDFGEESLPHDHQYLVEWSCAAERLDGNGFAVDIALMQELLAGLLARLAGHSLNDLQFFRERQASVENLAAWLHRELEGGLEERGYPVENLRESRVVVWESDTAWASFSASRP